MELRKFVAPEMVFGNGARILAAQYINNMGVQKIMIVSDPIVSEQYWFNDILRALNELEIIWTLVTDVSVNPRDTECQTLADIYNEEHCEMIMAVGGGSVIDCAKGVGVLVNNIGPISRYEGVDEICHPIPPLLCIPTTSGSAADISQFSIITNTTTHHKMALVSKSLVPDLALIDSEVTLTKDLDLTLDTGLDVLAHATESYVSNASSPLTDLNALEAVKLVISWLPVVANNLQDIEAREHMHRASTLAGMAFSNASLGLVHAIAHALGGGFDLIHGELNGMLLEAVVHFNYPEAGEKYAVIEKAIEELRPDYKGLKLYEMYSRFINELRKNRTLEEMGANWDTMRSMIHFVLSDPCIATNPRDVTEADVEAIYERIWSKK